MHCQSLEQHDRKTPSMQSSMDYRFMNRFRSEVKDVRRLGSKDKITVAMATCHSLTTINEEIVGDPVDLKMFEATDWVSGSNNYVINLFITLQLC